MVSMVETSRYLQRHHEPPHAEPTYVVWRDRSSGSLRCRGAAPADRLPICASIHAAHRSARTRCRCARAFGTPERAAARNHRRARAAAVPRFHGALPVRAGAGLLQRRLAQVRRIGRFRHQHRAGAGVRALRGGGAGAIAAAIGRGCRLAGTGRRQRRLRRTCAGGAGAARRVAGKVSDAGTQRRAARAPAGATARAPAERLVRARAVARAPARDATGAACCSPTR